MGCSRRDAQGARCALFRVPLCTRLRRGVLYRQVDARLGRAVETLDAMLRDGAAANTFDLCFIDADKRAYSDYFDRAMQLVRAHAAAHHSQRTPD